MHTLETRQTLHKNTPKHNLQITQVSIRVDDSTGNPGLTLADWFVDTGLDAPSAQKLARPPPPTQQCTVNRPPPKLHLRDLQAGAKGTGPRQWRG